MYIYQRGEWPHFTWDSEKIAPLLLEVRHQQGRLLGGMGSIGFPLEEEILLDALTQEVVQSNAIEGEILDEPLVRSSVARQLGLEAAALPSIDRAIDGVVKMTLDATQNYDQPLTQERLFSWHSLLFPLGRSGFFKIQVAAWRTKPVQVISEYRGEERVHFEGPPPDQVALEMSQFLEWLNPKNSLDLVLKAAIAHLWFVTIHPFDDGNGRIGRAIADFVLAQSEKSPRRFYSLSAQIQVERKGYYEILERTQKGGMEITPWIEWFLRCLLRAIEKALSLLIKVKEKNKVWEQLKGIPLNERQKRLIERLLNGFEGKLTSSKWAKIAKCSQDTAYRDLLDLVEKGVLSKSEEGGRSTSYALKISPRAC